MTKLVLQENWAKKFARDTAQNIYKQAPKKKINANEFQQHIESATQYGFIQALEHMILSFEIDPIEEGAVVIGEAQLLLVQEYNLFKKKYPTLQKDCSIEGIMERAKAFKEQMKEQGHIK